LDVGVVHPRPPLPLEPLRACGVVAEPRVAPQREGIGTEQPPGEIILHVSAHALDDGHHGDQKHHPNHDADEREEALELLHADLREGESNRFVEWHGWAIRYSLFTIRYSLFAIRYSPFAIRH